MIGLRNRQMARPKQQPHRYENRLWKAGYAWLSFQYVVDLCDYILTEQIQPEAKIYYPLVTAISVLYARPFKRSKGIESLTLQFVPKKMVNLHNQLILLRDQTIAHVDARGALYFQGLPVNNVRLIVRDHGRKIALSVQQLKFTAFAISEIRDLAGALVKRMLEYIQKVEGKSANDAPDDGEYLIDLETGNLRRMDS